MRVRFKENPNKSRDMECIVGPMVISLVAIGTEILCVGTESTISAMAPDTKANSSMGSFMGLANCITKVNKKTILSNTKVSGNEHYPMAEGKLYTKTEIPTKELSPMEFEVVMESMNSTVLLGTKVIGRITSFMAMVNCLGMESSFLKEGLKMV